jgi:hypothetical protein
MTTCGHLGPGDYTDEAYIRDVQGASLLALRSGLRQRLKVKSTSALTADNDGREDPRWPNIRVANWVEVIRDGLDIMGRIS